jgi:hypothetical protein
MVGKLYFSGLLEGMKELYESDGLAAALKKYSKAIKPAKLSKTGKKAKKKTKKGKKEYNSVFSVDNKEYKNKTKSGHEENKKYKTGEKTAFLQFHEQGVDSIRETAEKKEPQRHAKTIAAREMLYDMLAAKITENIAYVLELQKTINHGSRQYADGNLSMLKIEYDNPVFINNQLTYQRIFVMNENEGATVYGLTMEKSRSGNLETKARYDDAFKTFYFDSLNGVKDGRNSAYWEAWLNGQVVEEALDKKPLKKGDVVEWRLANERESGCGGSGQEAEKFSRKNEMDVFDKNHNPYYLGGFGSLPAQQRSGLPYGQNHFNHHYFR